jgi:FKBP-type peptidyl-prolyl cis-trans isomerase (trigger factor)
MGSKNVPHALDNSLAEKLKAKDLDDLRARIAGTASMRLQETYKQTINGSICNRLANDNKIDIPQWMAMSEAQFLAQKSKIQWDQIKEDDRQKLLNIAKRNCSVTLILEKIREVEPEAQLSDQEVFEMVKKYLHGRVKDIDASIKEMAKTNQLQILFVKIRDEYTLEFIGKKIKIVE